MAVLRENASLPEYQQFIKDLCAERGWDKNSPLELFLLFSEEVGELAKAIRNEMNLYQEVDKPKRKRFELEEEFADVFSYLMDLAKCFGVDLESALRNKEAVNAQRNWKTPPVL
jgi:NTP pyrophosphatase (non-canonical NTP hydrolase)